MGDQSTIFPNNLGKPQESALGNTQESSFYPDGESGISVLTECLAGPKSIFATCELKIDVESIYDNVDKKKNMTRFTALPTKLQKTNMPVTFHKQIKSSGYSGAPSSLKYSTTEKKKLAQK